METFYVSPEGDAMDKDQMKKQDPTFFDNPRSAKYQYGHGRYAVPAPPPDEPGESENFGGAYDTRLVAAAKQDLADADPENVSKLGTLMGDPNTLNKLTFTEEDVIILPDITNQNKAGLIQALNLMYAIGDDIYSYLNHIYDLKGTGFGDFMRRHQPDNLTQRGVGEKTVFV